MKTTKYPVLFKYENFVRGNSFLAKVDIGGRFLLEEEADGDVWIYGVQPGSISAGGDDQRSAANAFRFIYERVLLDIAEEANNFSAFKEEVKRFADDIDAISEKEWLEAVSLVQSGQITSSWLTKLPADSERICNVDKMSQSAYSATPYTSSERQSLGA